MAGKAKLTIDVTATTSGAVADLDKAKAAVKQYGDAADTATKQSRDVGGAIDSVGGVAGGATTGLRDMSDAIAMAGFPELAAGMGVTATALESLDGAATLYAAAQEGLSKAVVFFDGVMKALKLTILANPIFIIAAIIIAIGAAFVIAYMKCDTFRRIVDSAVDAVWDTIKTVYNWISSNWPLLLTILAGPFGLAVALVIKHRDSIWNAIKAVYNWFSDTWGNITEWISGAFSSAVSAVTTARDSIWNAIKSVYNWIRDTWDNITSWLSAPFTAAWNTISGIVDKIKGGIQGVIDKIKLIKFPTLPSWLPGDFMQKSAPAPTTAAAFAAPRVAGHTTAATVAGAGGVTINVQGALDPDAVARQIERILRTRSRRVGGVGQLATGIR